MVRRRRLSYRERKHLGLPYRDPPLPEVAAPLLEAHDAVTGLPGSSCVMCRQAVQHAILSRLVKEEKVLTAKGDVDWEATITFLAGRINASRGWVERGREVIRFGNWGVHSLYGRKLTAKHSKRSWDSTMYFLDRLGFAMEEFGGALPWHRLASRYELAEQHWVGPLKFGESYFDVWHSGGLVDVKFGCPACGTSMTVEDLLVPVPDLGADHQSDSWTYAYETGVCPRCELDAEVASTNTLSWWDIDLPGWDLAYNRSGRALGRHLPPRNLAPGRYLYCEMLDFGARESEDPPDEA
jgi:hypothetical protein